MDAFHISPTVMGLVRSEPKPGQKRRGNLRKVAKEAGKERASKSITVDRTQSYKNKYEGYEYGADFADYIEEKSETARVPCKDSFRKLRSDAVVAYSIIYKPKAEIIEKMTEVEKDKFFSDCESAMEEFCPALFRKSNVSFRARHLDELGDHLQAFGEPIDETGRYIGHKIDGDLMTKLNNEFPALMRKRGWPILDNDVSDRNRMKSDPEYRAQREQKKKRHYDDVNDYILHKQIEKLNEIDVTLEEVNRLVKDTDIYVNERVFEKETELEKEKKRFKKKHKSLEDERKKVLSSKEENQKVVRYLLQSCLNFFDRLGYDFKYDGQSLETLFSCVCDVIENEKSEILAAKEKQEMIEKQIKEWQTALSEQQKRLDEQKRCFGREVREAAIRLVETQSIENREKDIERSGVNFPL